MRLTTSAALLAVAALLAACGDDPSVEEGGIPEVGPTTIEDAQRDPGSADVIETIEFAAETRSADDCSRLATPAYLSQREHRPGEAALDACVRGVFDRDRGLLDGPIQIGDVRVHAKAATATVLLQGGGSANLTARLRLVREGPRWRLARIMEFVEPERRHLEQLLRAELVTGEVPFKATAARCAIKGSKRLSDAALEARLLSPSPRAIYAPAVACAQPEAIEIVLREVPPGLFGVSKPTLACARNRLASTPDRALIETLVDPDAHGAVRALVACDPAAVLASYRAYLVGPRLALSKRQADCILARLRALTPDQLAGAVGVEGTGAAGAACAGA